MHMSFSLRRLSVALVAATAVALLGPLAAQAATVAVFDDPAFVDTTNAAPDGESDNLQASLTAKGHTVKAFNGITAAAFSTALAGSTVLVIPEQEVADLAPALSGDAVHVIRGFVASGGGLILGGDVSFGSGTGSASLLDRVFGIVVTEGIGPGTTTKQAGAAGTALAGGPASLPQNDGTNFLTGLPAGASSIYANGANSSVVLFSVGNGAIAYLGWDWFNSNPPTGAGQDGGWQNVLGRAVNEVAGAGCNVSGSPGAETLTGTAGRDRICAYGGSDTVNAGAGNDIVFAGKGNDTVNGSAGKDNLVAGPGNDTLNGNAGNDRLNTRDGKRGNDHANGGAGFDRCFRDPRDHITSCV
jgi:Ca2+-binding RTX toxin-like protein